MMKRLFILLLPVCISTCLFSDVLDDNKLLSGEYGYGIEWFTNAPPLIVDGGGADVIDLRDFGKLEVRSTSSPINGDWHTGGIRDIHLNDNCELLHLGGITDIISIDEDAIAILKGGKINHINSYFDFMSTGHVDIYCQSGWSWIEEDENFDGKLDKIGITGLWKDNNPFTIDFIEQDGYDPVWENINVIEVPEPVGLFLLSVGGLLIHRK